MKLAIASLVSVILTSFLSLAADVPPIEEGYEAVTCASLVRLGNPGTGHRLHSHGVSYGSGSGQQSVTGYSASDDSNSLWIIRAALGLTCKRGESIPCGSSIRLQHMNTKNFLHSHYHLSPLSNQQEVSGYEGLDEGDNWKVVCNAKHTTWLREEPIQLQHVTTGAWLSISAKYQYSHPIPGQLEVSGSKSKNADGLWAAQVSAWVWWLACWKFLACLWSQSCG